MKSEGIRLERKATDVVPAGLKFRPLGDHILVKPIDWTPSKIVQVAGNARKPLCGEIVAVGPGMYPWKYNADRSKRWQSKRFVPTQVKVGDVVELGGLQYDGYDFPQIVMDNQLYVIASERDVSGIRQ